MEKNKSLQNASKKHLTKTNINASKKQELVKRNNQNVQDASTKDVPANKANKAQRRPRYSFAKKSKILLIGFMGCGKSSLAPLLAKELDLMPLDSDHLIKAKVGKSINYMFEHFGEEFFRNEEKKVGMFLRRADGFVCALGGGFAGLKDIKRLGLVIYLRPSFEQVKKRLKSNKNRPLNDANIKSLFDSRLSLYKKNAHITQDLRGKNIKVVVKEVAQKIKEYK